MCYRWGYTPRSLAQVMHDAGLRGLRREPARFKLGDPRDCGSSAKSRFLEDQRCEQCSIRSRSWNQRLA